MSIQNFIKALTSKSKRGRQARRRPPVSRLRFEPLEERRLLSFSPPVDYGAGLTPVDLVAADFNGDGLLDLAALDNANSTVSVLLGNGEGTFQLPRTSSTGDGPKALVAGDLNGDGKDDLMTLHQFDLSVLLANGDGTFAPPQTITPPLQVPPDNPDEGELIQGLVSVALGDFNGDGALEIVAGGQTVWFTIISDPEGGSMEWHVNSYANVLLGVGDGTFSPAVVKHFAGGYPLLHPGDFNNDGQFDVVFNGGSALGNGDGTLQDFVQSSVYVGDGSQSVGDFNGDGNLDVLSNVSHAGGPFLQLGNGDGTFQQGQYLDSNFYQHGTVAGDVNADGKLDVVSLRSDYEASDVYDGYAYITATTRSARVLLGNSNGSFALPIIVEIDTAAGQTDFTAPVLADFDGDGFPDLAAIETFTPSDEGPVVYRGVHVALNDGNWTPPPSITMSDATVTFAPGETTKTITIEVRGDSKREAHKSYFVDLYNNSLNSLFTKKRGVGTILNDD